MSASHATVVDCPECQGEGVTHHDCGEDSCCCLDPEPNVPCRVCEGSGAVEVPEDEGNDEGAKSGNSPSVVLPDAGVRIPEGGGGIGPSSPSGPRKE